MHSSILQAAANDSYMKYKNGMKNASIHGFGRVNCSLSPDELHSVWDSTAYQSVSLGYERKIREEPAS
jgi:hypothetical protein